MARIKIIIFFLIAFFAFEAEVKAQEDSTTFYGMNWYLKKTVAIEAARKQGKQIFLLWGLESCPDCKWVKQKLSEPPFKAIIDENYVLWFSSNDIYTFDSEEVGVYLAPLKNVERKFYPVNCVIDSFDFTVASGFMFGPDFSLGKVSYEYETNLYHQELTALLNSHVSNDVISIVNDSDATIYVVNNNLVIKSKSADETVNVFTLTGSLVDRFHKTGYEITHNSSKYPKGILIVTGSSGWTQKVIIK